MHVCVVQTTMFSTCSSSVHGVDFYTCMDVLFCTYGNNGRRHSSVVFENFRGPVESNRISDVPVQFSVCRISRKFVWMQNHRNHHRDPSNDVVKEGGGHSSRKHLKTWFGTSVFRIWAIPAETAGNGKDNV